MNKMKQITLGLALLSCSSVALATVTTNVKSCDNQSWYTNDYGDAPSTYEPDVNNNNGRACHDTAEWQRLGNDWDTDSITSYSDDGDDGVSWATSSDGGDTWTDYSTDNELTQGDLVSFKFDFTRATYGNHEFDLLKAWVDWDQSGSFINDSNASGLSSFESSSDVIIEETWYKNVDSEGNYEGDWDGYYSHYHNTWVTNQDWNNDLNTYNSMDTSGTYFAELTVPLNAATGETWMRARVVCENSLQSHSDQYNLLATGYQDQGEVEDYKLVVKAKSTTPEVTPEVPEPSSLLVFAAGLLGLVAKNRLKLNRSVN